MSKVKIPEGWTSRRFGELFKVKHGYAFKGKFFSDSGSYIVLTPGNFFDEGGFKLKSKEKFYLGDFPSEYLLERDDLLVAMTEQAEGLLGSSALIPQSGLFLHNQRLGLITQLDHEVDKHFLYHLFNTCKVRAQIQASASGTKVRHTSPTRIYEVEVPLPPLPTQRKIAAVLSAYDDLIENNTRRIAILEEMAQAIYREWFVHFRFPGHESVPLIQSDLGPVPEGWEVVVLGDVAKEIRRNKKPDEFDPETPYVGLEHIPRKSIALTNWGQADQIKSTKLAFKKGEILFGKIRPYFHKVAVAPINGICSTDTIVIVPKKSEYFSIVLCCVSNEHFVEYATTTSQGTKMPRADWKVLVKYPIILSSKSLLNQFSQLVEDVVAQIQNLIFRNHTLRQTRDLLLPRLISGEVDVSALAIDLANE